MPGSPAGGGRAPHQLMPYLRTPALALVLVAGSASGSVATGTPKEKRWRIPAAWRAQVRGGLIEVWQVYADNTPVYALLKHDG